MFAGEPPSSSNPTKRLFSETSSALEAFRPLLLQIGGANIAGPDRALERACFVVVRGGKACPLSSFGDEKHVTSLLLSAARGAIRV